MYPYNIQSEVPKDDANTELPYQNPSPAPVLASKHEHTPPHPPRHHHTDTRLLELIDVAIHDEQRNAYNYQRIMERVKNAEQRALIRSMRNDAMKHIKILQNMYHNISGHHSPTEKEDYKFSSASTDKEQENINELFYNDMLDCHKAIEFYRQIYFSSLNLEMRDMLFEIITDKQSTSNKNLLLHLAAVQENF